MGTYATAVPEPLDARERRELCDLFGDLGPSAPTLCEGWATLDLATHLVVRERRPQAGPGLFLGGPFARALERATAKVKAKGYDAVVELVRNGPPLGPFAVPGLRSLINLNEYAVHFEDVRRANGLGPRTDRPDLQDALWGILRRGARLQLRKVRTQIATTVARPGGESVTVGQGPAVTLTGDPVDLALYLSGRKDAAQVDLTGSPEAVAILRETSLGI
jgi:uncharacterized protein (TIGR03085 family)